MRFAFGDYELDTDSRALDFRGKQIPVEPRVFEVLAYLIEHRERFVPVEELRGAVWPGVAVGSAALSQALHKARHAVGDDGAQQRVLRTEHGHGYRFVADASQTAFPLDAGVGRSRLLGPLSLAAALAELVGVGTSVWLLNRLTGDTALIPSVAVLPVVNLTADPDQEHLADSISELILNSLGQCECLRVAGRTSSSVFKGSGANVKTIGEALDVESVVEGSVRRAGTRVRISVQLVSVKDGFQLWSETHDREFENIFSIQDEIARSIICALRAEFELPANGEAHNACPEARDSRDVSSEHELEAILA